ncbi:hypothetical protein SNE40_023463 [Patella caerulea]|uniref:Cyclopropane-fatty-acyl-phospholipid synthase n=1 Tax=Patella caerulea TaxID=87958 RepID=A0AAN8FYJ2_PATCE
MKKVAIIGGGISGIATAYNLWKKGLPGSHITLFEARDKLGGHSRLFHHPNLSRPVDVGFQVFNLNTYPLLLQFFRELDVDICDSDMSFSVENESFAWGSKSGLWSLFVAFLQAPIQMLKFLWTLFWFFRDARSYIQSVDSGKHKHVSIGEFCRERKYCDEFMQGYLIPFTASVWSATADNSEDFDAFTIFTFMANHHLLEFRNLKWKTLTHTSESYINAFLHKCKPIVNLKKRVASLKQNDNLKWRINDSEDEYDDVVLALHAPDVQHIHIEATSGDTDELVKKMASVRFDDKYVIIHQDASLMPKSKLNWSSWNFNHGVVTYWENSLQPIGFHFDVFVSIIHKEIMKEIEIDQDKYLSKPIIMAHPAYGLENIQLAKDIRNLQGCNGLYACGAYLGYGFHEDGYRSGYEVAQLIGDRAVDMYESVITYNRSVEDTYSKGMLQSLSDNIALGALKQLLASNIRKGCIGIQTPGYGIEFFGEVGVPTVLVDVRNPSLAWKCLLQGDIGLAESYIDESLRVDNLPLLLFYLVINTYPAPQTLTWRPLVFFFTNMWPRIGYTQRLKNTPAVAKQNIIDHYDLGNDFFETFLDSTMTYSSGIFLKPSDDLEIAQLRKYDRLLDLLDVPEGGHILEIGCGWGGMAVRAATTRRCFMSCITISPEQAKYCRELVLKRNLQDSVKIYEIDFRDIITEFAQLKFDAVVSIEMIEAIGPDNYDLYFKTISSVLKPYGKVAIQAITRFEDQYEKNKREPDFINQYIFPGGCLPSLGAISQHATRNNLVISEVYNISESYAKTLAIWREKFNRATKKQDFKFDHKFIRIWNMYFSMCQAAFEANSIQDFHIVMEAMRVDSSKFL